MISQLLKSLDFWMGFFAGITVISVMLLIFGS